MHQQVKQTGSVVLAILSIAALSSIALFAVFLSLKSMVKTLGIEKLQHEIQEILYAENANILSTITQNPSINLLPLLRHSIISNKGLEYEYMQKLSVNQQLMPASVGFSLNSNYSSKLIKINTKISNPIIQSPMLESVIKCISTVNGKLNSQQQNNYLMDNTNLPWIHGFKFNSSTGEIWRKSAAMDLLIDFDFTTTQQFSRPDFVITKFAAESKLGIIFTVQHSKTTDSSAENKLYVLFHDLNVDTQVKITRQAEDLIVLTNDYVYSDEHRALALTLKPGQLITSAITTVQHQILFITQQPQINPATGLGEYKNSLYIINLKPVNGDIIQIKTLNESSQLLELTTFDARDAEITLGTQHNPSLYTSTGLCNVVYQHEK